MINLNHISNMPCLLATLETERAGHVIIRYLDGLQVQEVTGSMFFREVRRCAASLYRLGLAGKHIGIMGSNRLQWLVHFCAVFEIGAVAVLLSPDLNRSELTARAELADIDYVLYDTYLKDILPSDLPGHSMDRRSPDETEDYPLPRPDAEDLACILFTSGTTSAGKAVMLSHRSLIAGSCHNVVGHHFDAQLAVLPMHHIAGFATVLNSWYLGATVCLGQDLRYLYRYLELMKPDYVLTVPAILQVILRKLKKGGGPNGQEFGWNLRLLGCGGAAFPRETLQTLNAQNITVLQSYGATELGGLGFDWEMTPGCAGTIGKPSEGMAARIVDGELFLRSDSMMTGYYKDPEGTAVALRDGWYATGDLCEWDENGNLRLLGRKKNLIIRSNGENVHPEEIEGYFSDCSRIAEIMVGLEENLITATVYPARSDLQTKSEILNALNDYNRTVPLYKQIQRLRFSDAPFAKTETGKMIRQSVTGGNAQ